MAERGSNHRQAWLLQKHLFTGLGVEMTGYGGFRRERACACVLFLFCFFCPNGYRRRRKPQMCPAACRSMRTRQPESR